MLRRFEKVINYCGKIGEDLIMWNKSSETRLRMREHVNIEESYSLDLQ